MGLVSLPSELLMAILVDLGFRDLLRFREVCTRLKSLIDDDVSAQYKLELAVAAMEDGPSSSLTPVERLSALRARKNAWSRLAWSAAENIPMHGGLAWDLYGNVLAQSEGERTLYLKRIPSAIRGIEGKEWVIPDGGCDIEDIGMDPAQDLLIIVERFWDGPDLTSRIHLRALSTGAPHPAASRDTMLTSWSRPRSYCYSTLTSGDHIGILMSCVGTLGSKELLIWDWKTGSLRLHFTGAGIPSWSFLTQHILLVAEMYYIDHKEQERAHYAPRLVVIDLNAVSSSSPVTLSEADYACVFHYPPLGDDTRLLHMAVSLEPGPTPVPGVPFSVSTERSLVLITLRLSVGHEEEEVVVRNLVPASTFLRALGTVAPGEIRHDFRWDEWGPRGSRLIWTPEMHGSSETCHAYGTVFATTEMAEDTPDRVSRKVVILRDFNQLAIRRREVSGTQRRDSDPESGDRGEEQSMRVVSDAIVFEPAGVFKKEVTTSLPYMERVFVLPKEAEDLGVDAVMPTEDALVLVMDDWESGFRVCILSF